MANHKSAKKAAKQMERRRMRNREVRSALKTFVKNSEGTIKGGEPVAADEAVLKAVSGLDVAVRKGVVHKNQAARRKSRLMRKLNATKSAG